MLSRQATRLFRDPLLIKSRLTNEELSIWETAHSYAQQMLEPRIQQDYAAESMDRILLKELGDLGFLGCTHTDFGLPGISPVAYGLINRALDYVDSGYRTALGVQNELCIFPILTYAPPDVKDRLIPGLISGDLVGCYGLTEPNNGSNPANLDTKAKKVGAKYVLNGSKIWISNAPIADVFVIWAKNNEGVVQGFVLEKDFPGLSVTPIKGKLSLRASPTGFVHMEEVEVPLENKLEVDGLRGPFSCLAQARFGLAWGPLGAAEACYHIATEYSKERRQFGKPLAQTQLIQKKLADMATELAIGFEAAFTLSKLKEKQLLSAEVISMMKRNACVKAMKIARDARDILGGNGIIDEYKVMRHMLNLEAINTYEGTEDVHALVLGRGITGLSAFN